MRMKIFLSLIFFLFPWGLRRRLLNLLFGYQIHPDARIGFSLIVPEQLVMQAGAVIGNFNVCRGVELLHMGERSIISRMNWITGMPRSQSKFFLHKKDRHPSLRLGAHSAITSSHYLDCTDEIRIGEFTTIAGLSTQFLTHSIDLYESRQDCQPISIGDYCFVGTRSVLLPGAALGDYNVLAAASLLNKKFVRKQVLIGGVPAKVLKYLPIAKVKYFSRTDGFIS